MQKTKHKEDGDRPTLQAARQVLARCADVWDMTLPWPRLYWDIDLLRRYHRAGFTYVNLTVQDLPATFGGVQDEITAFRELCEPHADWLRFAPSMRDVDATRALGCLALGLNVQDTDLVHDDFDRLRVLQACGVRHMVLAYQTRNRAADGCAEPADAGLSLLGRRLVREMNRIGIVVDVSHTGRRSSLEAMSLSQAPVIFSHSGVFAVCRHIRNIDDEQIRACAATDGVVGIVGIGAFLGDPQASTDCLFRHVDHVAQLVGPHHVGIGTDFIDNLAPIWDAIRSVKEISWTDPYGTQLYEGVGFGPERLVELVEKMMTSGYPVVDIEGILGANFRRVYRAVEVQEEMTTQ